MKINGSQSCFHDFLMLIKNKERKIKQDEKLSEFIFFNSIPNPIN